MTFNSLEFPLFFSAVVVGLCLLRSVHSRKLFLLVASWYFYSIWSVSFAGLLIMTALVHWLAGRINKTWTLWAAVGFSVATLATFKYLGLWINSVVMPVGLSFYTFQAISYTVDVHRGVVDGKKTFWDVALYIGFFPQLLSGPIVRSGDFLGQLAQNRGVTKDGLALGFGQFAIGLFKKVFIADRMAVYVGDVFENCNLFGGATLWLAAIAYTIQIYCDFSGYSDMAIGTAKP